MANFHAFRPAGPTVSLTAGVASSNVRVQTGPYSRHVRIYNAGSSVVFVAFSELNTIAAATTTGMPIGPGQFEIFGCPEDYVAGISGPAVVTSATTNGTTASGNATLHFAATPSGLLAGDIILDVTAPTVIPANTTVLSVTATTVVMSANATGAGVGGTDSITFQHPSLVYLTPGDGGH